MTPFPQATLLATMLAGRYRPGHHRDHSGFLQHAFATSPWLGATVAALIVAVGLAITLIKVAGRVVDGAPWYVRLALLATAAFGIFRVLNRNSRGVMDDAL